MTNFFSGLYNKIPKFVVGERSGNFYGKISKISTPGQRAILMVSAIPTQTGIDVNNKSVDEDTAIISASRTLAKVVVGGCVGIIVRQASIKALENLTKKGRALSCEAAEKLQGQAFEYYHKCVGSALGIFVCLFTNFLLDAPLTVMLTNFFLKKVKTPEDKGRLA